MNIVRRRFSMKHTAANEASFQFVSFMRLQVFYIRTTNLFEMKLWLETLFKAGLRSRSRSRKESEVFGWSRSRISNNTGSRSRIFLSDCDSGRPVGSFLDHTPKLGIPVEMVQFLSKLLLKQNFFAVYHDFHWFQQPNFIPFMESEILESRNRESESEILESRGRESESEIVETRGRESDILPPTTQPWLETYTCMGILVRRWYCPAMGY